MVIVHSQAYTKTMDVLFGNKDVSNALFNDFVSYGISIMS